jgi:hypothetical protein
VTAAAVTPAIKLGGIDEDVVVTQTPMRGAALSNCYDNAPKTSIHPSIVFQGDKKQKNQSMI